MEGRGVGLVVVVEGRSIHGIIMIYAKSEVIPKR